MIWRGMRAHGRRCGAGRAGEAPLKGTLGLFGARRAAAWATDLEQQADLQVARVVL
jgi:hypothetical protein